MKKKGSKQDFTAHRNHELVAAFRQAMEGTEVTDVRKLFRRVVQTPASRFWVSEYRAADVISRMLRGDTIEDMNRKKRDMYREIFIRTIGWMKACPGISRINATQMAVHSPAPEFYMTPDSARVIIYRLRAKNRKNA